MEQLPTLREAEFGARFSIDDYLTAVDRAFRLYGEGQLVNPPRVEVVEKREGMDYFRLEMPATWPGRYRARKIIEEYSDVAQGRLGQRRAFVRLEDLQRMRWVEIDANLLTDARTGAAGALGIRYLAGEQVPQVGILGTGRIARALAVAVDRLLTPEEIRVTSRSAANREKFIGEVGPLLDAALRPAGGLEECVSGSQAVLVAVPTRQPILGLELLDEQVCLAVMAGDSRTRQVEPAVLEQIGVVVDQLEQAQDSGEFRHARETGRCGRIALARDRVGEVLDIGDAACGRLDAAEPRPRLAYFTGLAVQDLCAAIMIYEALRGK